MDWLSVNDPLEKIDIACTGAKLLAISFVQYLSGFRADLKAIGEICRRHNCFFFVDAIQGLGAFPLDVEAAHIDALAADGHKWLLGPEGCGILYVRKSRQDAIFPEEFGWTNVAGYNDYASRDMTLRQDAGRYECGTLNTIGCYGLRASIELLLEAGVERIAARRSRSLADQLAAGAAKKGYQTTGGPDAGKWRGNHRDAEAGPGQPKSGVRPEAEGDPRRSAARLGAVLAAFLHQPGGDRSGGRSFTLVDL